MIIIKALLLERLKAYLTRKTKHAIKTMAMRHLLVTLLACPKILCKLVGAC